MGLAAAFLFINNRFTGINVGLWCISIISLLLAFFPQINWRQLSGTFNKIYANIFHSGFHFRISPWTLLILLSFIVVCFLRFYRLDQVPIEMISDQAEKLLDVNDILGGTFSIFFPRNTGREAFQMYLSALMSVIFGTGISFLTLKIGTAIMGVITAIYLYFLGKEVGNRWVGLFALILCGIGYWPNVILESACGLHFIQPLLPRLSIISSKECAANAGQTWFWQGFLLDWVFTDTAHFEWCRYYSLLGLFCIFCIIRKSANKNLLLPAW